VEYSLDILARGTVGIFVWRFSFGVAWAPHTSRVLAARARWQWMQPWLRANNAKRRTPNGAAPSAAPPCACELPTDDRHRMQAWWGVHNAER